MPGLAAAVAPTPAAHRKTRPPADWMARPAAAQLEHLQQPRVVRPQPRQLPQPQEPPVRRAPMQPATRQLADGIPDNRLAAPRPVGSGPHVGSGLTRSPGVGTCQRCGVERQTPDEITHAYPPLWSAMRPVTLTRRGVQIGPIWRRRTHRLARRQRPLVPMSAHTHRDGHWLALHRAISGCGDPGQARGTGFTLDPRVTAARPQLRSMRRPASSDRGQGKSRARAGSDVIGTSPSAICLAEHRVQFGVGHELPDFLRTAARGGDLGSPLQRFFA